MRQAELLFGAFYPERDKALDLITAATLASEHITTSQAHFTERDFIRHMAEQAQCTGLLASDVISGARVGDHRKAHHFRKEMIVEKCTT